MTTENLTTSSNAPAWVYATDPDEGIVYCLCCHAGTDPQEAFESPGKRNHKEDCNAVALIRASTEVLAIESAKDVLEEIKLYPKRISAVRIKEHNGKVDAALALLRSAVEQAGCKS